MQKRNSTFNFSSAMTLLLLLASVGGAEAHRERPTSFPPGTGAVPTYRTDGPYLVVCKDTSKDLSNALNEPYRTRALALVPECRIHHLQEAIDNVTVRGTRILVLPGTYKEEPSRAPLSEFCETIRGHQTRTYEEQASCPHADNLVAILGDGNKDGRCDGRLCDLQIEGMGEKPSDVIIDGEFSKLNVIRADRADGFYVRNLAVQKSMFTALYILETDGFAIDGALARWNAEYGFLTFTVDHGLYQNCEAHGNGDSGIYPGSASPLEGTRPAVTIRGCNSHDNFIGLSGTAGNSLLVENNNFSENSIGVSLDSLFPNHPGLPQRYSVFRENKIYDNNQDFYRYWRDGTCLLSVELRGIVERDVVCPLAPAPVGTGILLAGGNSNTFEGNWIAGNSRYGVMQFWVPPGGLAGFDREPPDGRPYFETSNRNRYVNRFGLTTDGFTRPNGIDVWWDSEGIGNCWEQGPLPAFLLERTPPPLIGSLRSDPSTVPSCLAPSEFHPPDPNKVNALLSCSMWRPPGNLAPNGCPWFSR